MYANLDLPAEYIARCMQWRVTVNDPTIHVYRVYHKWKATRYGPSLKQYRHTLATFPSREAFVFHTLTLRMEHKLPPYIILNRFSETHHHLDLPDLLTAFKQLWEHEFGFDPTSNRAFFNDVWNNIAEAWCTTH